MGLPPLLLLALGVIWARLPLAAAQAPFPKPTISLSPNGELAPGMDVSFYCHGSRSRVRFRLYRAGVVLRHTEPAGSTAEFRITNARLEDGGNYTCLYESLTEPPSVSPHSDPIELVVAASE
ncbi:T-cell-interacting, activating receptor on myeloid cells protein 1-like [Pelodiscus sinensis]|uniref:T-cell-interacting, activating receptor on myeloid cells protein 1-like n=1 Tax=Pelodiscus sinensis TaxID=13735 RepID=UPI003F6C76C3